MTGGPIGDGNSTKGGCLLALLLAVLSTLLVIGLLILAARAVT